MVFYPSRKLWMGEYSLSLMCKLLRPCLQSDADLKAAKKTKIVSQAGTPLGFGLLGYDSETVLPTGILTDATGKVIFADLTDNYRVRPEPDTFIQIFNQYDVVA